MSEETNNSKKVIVYSTPTCHFCHLVKDFLKENNIDFTEHNLIEETDKQQEVMEKTGQMAVPVIDIEGEIIIGFDKQKLMNALNLSE